MGLRLAWPWLLACCLGCQSLLPAQPPEEASPGWQHWQKGQAAMRQGQTREAVAWFRRSLAADATLTRNHISLAAAYLDLSEGESARPHLEAYCAAHPDQLAIRGHLAELLMRLHRPMDARREFERYAAGLQEQDDPGSMLVHCHTRLMEIAEAAGDEYDEHLHRGIGLYYLGHERARLGDDAAGLSAESLFCKAAGELVLARAAQPDACRPSWYLYEIWTHLSQRQTAAYWLQRAWDEAPFSTLSPAEHRSLQLAYQLHRNAASAR